SIALYRFTSVKQGLIKPTQRFQNLKKQFENIKKKGKKKQSFDKDERNGKSVDSNINSLVQKQKLSIGIEELDAQNQIIREQQDDINAIDQKTHQTQKAVNELAIEADKQDQFLDIINYNQVNVKTNLTKANQELIEAGSSQQSANRKYCILAILALILVVVLLVIIFRDQIF
ncbi:hypothetical protein pb186bvf_013840, partial [Paramecium bursaria]